MLQNIDSIVLKARRGIYNKKGNVSLTGLATSFSKYMVNRFKKKNFYITAGLRITLFKTTGFTSSLLSFATFISWLL